jgi:Cys-rich peptide (TIGR04165 family)
MKSELLNQPCPECGCVDKRISRKRNRAGNEDAFYIPHIPEGDVGVMKCSECGHIFEVFEESKMPIEVKKKLV